MSLFDRQGDGRTIEPSGDSPSAPASDRFLSPVRQALAARGSSAITDGGQQIQAGRSLDLPREPLVSRGGIGALVPSVGSSALPLRRYEGSDPFSVLADIFAGTFAGDNPLEGTTQFSVVPQTVGGGGGNTFAILAVLLLAGVGIWWFYFRKQGAEN